MKLSIHALNLMAVWLKRHCYLRLIRVISSDILCGVITYPSSEVNFGSVKEMPDKFPRILDQGCDVIIWKHFPRYWSFMRGILRPPVDSPCKSQWRGALICSLMCAWTNVWSNSPDAGDLRRHGAHCDVTVMWIGFIWFQWFIGHF